MPQLKGEEHPNAVLNSQIVISIRNEDRSTISNEFLANKYGVDSSTLSRARNNKTWKHVKGDT